MPRFFITAADQTTAARAIGWANEGDRLWIELPGAEPIDLLSGDAVTPAIPASVTIAIGDGSRSGSLIAVHLTEEQLVAGGRIRVEQKRRGLVTVSIEDAPVIHLVFEPSELASIPADFSGAISLQNGRALPDFPATKTVRSFAVRKGAKIEQWSALVRMSALERLTVEGLLCPLGDLRRALGALGVGWLKLGLMARCPVKGAYDDIVEGAEMRTLAVARALTPIVDPTATSALATAAIRGGESRSSREEPDKYASASIDVSTSERRYEERQGPFGLRFVETELVQRDRTAGWRARATKSEATVLGLSAAAELRASEHAAGTWGSDGRATETRSRMLTVAGEPARVLAAVDRFVADDSAMA